MTACCESSLVRYHDLELDIVVLIKVFHHIMMVPDSSTIVFVIGHIFAIILWDIVTYPFPHDKLLIVYKQNEFVFNEYEASRQNW